MGEYHRARSELKELIVSLFKLDATAKGHPDTLDLNSMLDGRAETTLANFERVATAHHHRSEFWFGVWQSFVGSLLFLLALALFALLIYGFKQNPFRVLTDESTVSPVEKASPAPIPPSTRP